MSVWSRIANVFRRGASREIDEEFESHIAEAIEQGRDPAEARRAFGSPLRLSEQFHRIDANGALEPIRDGTFIVRAASRNPISLASILRREVPRARAEFRVSNIRTQKGIVESHTVRERLLAMLALFFAGVAVLLAGIGLYGVLDYSVLQRRREIGIRMALGARAAHVARGITADVFAMVLVGAATGLALGLTAARYIASLLYQVKATDISMLALPALTILAAAMLAALPAVIRAVRIDPATTLRAE